LVYREPGNRPSPHSNQYVFSNVESCTGVFFSRFPNKNEEIVVTDFCRNNLIFYNKTLALANDF